MNNGFTYDPLTEGAITSIDAAVNKNLTDVFGPGIPGSPLGNTFRPLIEQSGVFYLAAIPGPPLLTIPSTSGYHLLAQTGLVATNFTSYDFATGTFGSAHPDFSGAPLAFGLAQISGVNWYTPGQIIADYQNLLLDIHSTPEPNEIVLLAAALLGLMWIRRSTRRSGRG